METALIDTVTDSKSLALVVSAAIIALGVLGFIVRIMARSSYERMIVLGACRAARPPCEGLQSLWRRSAD
jgi:hypothetical protein